MDRVQEIENVVPGMDDLEMAKDNIYPVLISTEKNEQLLQELVFTPFLDLSAIYFLQYSAKNGEKVNIKMTRQLLERYGNSLDELHNQALSNRKKDGYGLISMEKVLMKILWEEIFFHP